jgi:hypothetical protein
MPAAVTSLVAYLVEKFGRGAVKTGILATMKVATWTIYIAFVISLLAVISGIIQSVEAVMSMLQNPAAFLSEYGMLDADTSCNLDYITYVLNGLSFYDTLNSCLAIILPSVVFILGVLTFNISYAVKLKLEKDTKDMLNLI